MGNKNRSKNKNEEIVNENEVVVENNEEIVNENEVVVENNEEIVNENEEEIVNENEEEIVNENEEEVVNEDEEEVEKEPEVKENEEVNEDENSEIKNAVVVNCAKLNVRKEPNKEAEVLCIIDKNTEITVDVVNSTEDFYKVFTSSNETLIEGYCVKKFIEVK